MATEKFFNDLRDSGNWDADATTQDMLNEWLGNDYREGQGPTREQKRAIAEETAAAQASYFNGDIKAKGDPDISRNSVSTDNKAELDDIDIVRDTDAGKSYIKTSQGDIPTDKAGGATYDQHGNKILMDKKGRFIGKVI